MNPWNDLRSSARILLHEPGFAALTILTVALGVGANTAIFSIVNGVLLRPLPYGDPDRLVALREVVPAIAQTYPTLPVSARHFTEWRQRLSSFERLSAVDTGNGALTGAGEPEQLDIARVSADLFETLGVQPAMGRTFVRGEDQSGHDRVAIISDSLWRRRFSANSGILGKTIQLDSQSYTVIGILPPWFRFPSARVLEVGQVSVSKPEVFRPLVFDDDEMKELMGNFNYTVIAKLKRGVSADQSLAELNVIAAQLVKMSGEKMELRASVIPMRDSIVGKSRRGLWVLLAGVGAVMLIGCVNLANLLLARSERRAKDVAIRAAIGASGGQLVRQALVETVFLAVIGGVLGVTVAAAGLGALVRSAPPDIPRLDEVRLDFWVLVFALAITTATGLLFGLAPAWRVRRADPQDALKSGGHVMTGGVSGARLRGALIAAEMGLSVILLVTAGLLMSSFARLIRTDKGFRAPTVLAGDVQIPWEKYKKEEQRNAFHERLLDRLRAEPGVVSAAVVTALPLTGETWVDMASLPGDTRPELERPMVNVRFASADYFRTMGIPLLAGRTFSDNDRKRNVAVISERVAHALWPGQNAVGRQFASNETTREVIGVVGDVLAEPHRPAVSIVYRPYWDWSPRRVELVARAAGDPRSIASAMHAAIRSVDPDVPLPELHTMQEVLAESLAQRQFQMLLILAFAGTAIVLAAMGIYGVVSYSVTRRRNEMGVRMALGARAQDLYAMVIRQAMIPVTLGLLLGLVGALAAGRVLSSLLFEVGPRDPIIITAVIGVLLAVALAACLVPARRAAAASPLEALRCE
jgi:putative ABC transport system permease protein